MSGAVGARQKLEATATAAVHELLNLPTPLLATNPSNSNKKSRLTPPSPSPSHKTNTLSTSSTLERSLRQFFDKLPYNHGAQLCIEDLLGRIRKLKRVYGNEAKTNATLSGITSSAEEKIIAGTIQYLACPGFVDHLAAFGKLPNHPYILAFDPYAYQSKTPPTEDESRVLDPVAFADCVSGGGSVMTPTRAELELLDKELNNIYQEKLQKGRIKCPKCKESKFMHFHEEQRRSADEGSSYVFFCANCGSAGHSR
jgi:DNA-directed RNA polymerase subunit M/transcription elongation factor TFIIS